MLQPIRIASSILSADFTRLGSHIAEAEAAGTDWIHIDVMDGVFVPPISYGLPIIAAARKATTLPLDVHLMIVQPERHIQSVIEAGADIVTVHAEVSPHLHMIMQQIRALGAKPGISINPQTPVVLIEELLPFVDMVLVMTVTPGYGGQRFVQETLHKITQVQRLAADMGRELLIEVDGGINADTVPAVVAHGANVLVAGTSVFGAPGGPVDGITSLRTAIDSVGYR